MRLLRSFTFLSCLQSLCACVVLCWFACVLIGCASEGCDECCLLFVDVLGFVWCSDAAFVSLTLHIVCLKSTFGC